MFLDVLRRKKPEAAGDFQEEIRRLRSTISRLDKDTDTTFRALNEIRPAVSDSQRKLNEIYDFTRLALQNHERLGSIEKELKELKTHISSAGQILTRPQTSQPSQAFQHPKTPQGHFSDTSLNSVNSSLKSLNYPVPQEKIPEKASFLSVLDTLTAMEKRTFVVLAALIKESAEKEVDFENLVRELYPSLPVSARRSTVSNFLRRLESLGLVKRERRGRKRVIVLADKGLKALSEQAFKQLEASLIRKRE